MISNVTMVDIEIFLSLNSSPNQQIVAFHKRSQLETFILIKKKTKKNKLN